MKPSYRDAIPVAVFVSLIVGALVGGILVMLSEDNAAGDVLSRIVVACGVGVFVSAPVCLPLGLLGGALAATVLGRVQARWTAKKWAGVGALSGAVLGSVGSGLYCVTLNVTDLAAVRFFGAVGGLAGTLSGAIVGVWCKLYSSPREDARRRSSAPLVPIAALDTQIVSNLSSPTLGPRVEKLIKSLRDEGFAVAITGTVLSELAATKDEVRWHGHFAKVKSVLDLVIPIERGDMVRLEIEGKDPRDYVLTKLYDAQGFPDVSKAREDPELWKYNEDDRAWKGRLRDGLSSNDKNHVNLTPDGIPSFAEYLDAEKTNQAVVFLNTIRDGLFDREVTEEWAKDLLGRGFSFRAAILLGLANQYDRQERGARGLQTKQGGSLSDAPMLSEAAYFELLVTCDEDFGRAGDWLAPFMPTPRIRYVKL